MANDKNFKVKQGIDANGVITTIGGNSTNWNTAYGWGNHASAGYLSTANYGSTLNSVYARATRGVVTGVNKDTYVTAFTVNGDALASAIRVSFAGTGPSLVINCVADILVNHYQDILISTQQGFYTKLSIKVTSSNNEDFAVEVKHNGGANTLSLNVDVFPLNNETIDFVSSHSYTGPTKEHLAEYGMTYSGSGGGLGSITTDGIVSAATMTSAGLISANGGIALGDNDKATFGAGDDLQIYHDGSNSYVNDQGTGDLILRASSSVKLQSASGGVEFLSTNSGTGALTLAPSNFTGSIEVTGTATMDGLTVTGTLGNFAVDTQGVIATFSRPSTSYIRASDVSGSLRFDAGGSLARLNIASNGDISFYEDTGTAAKLFWDASAESLGIGTSAPASALDVIGANKDAIKIRSNVAPENYYQIGRNQSTGLLEFFGSEVTYNGYLFKGPSSDLMTINANGRVGIGTSSPSAKLHVQSASSGGTASGNADELILEGSGNTGLTILSGATSVGNLFFADSGDAADGFVQYDQSGRSMRFGTAATERLRIDSSGNVGIGTSSLVNGDKLTVNGNFNLNGTLFNGTSNNSAGLDFTSNYVNLYGYSGIRFYAQAAGIGSMAERMRIDSSGNVGIGTSAPTSALDVNGTVTADGIELDSNDQYILAGAGAGLKIGHDASSSIIRSQVGPMYIDGNGITFRGYSPYTKHMDIATNGDVSFYEDTGTTAKLFWDASAEALSIGTSTAVTDRRFQVTGSNTGLSATVTQFGIVNNPTFTNTITNNIFNLYTGPNISSGATLGNLYNLYLEANNFGGSTVTNSFGLYQAGVNDKNYFAGKVGIGTNSPSQLLHLTSSGFAYARFNNSSFTGIDIGQHSGGNIYFNNRDNTSIIMQTNNTERMRIDASGNVGIGTSSPTAKLTVALPSGTNGDIINMARWGGAYDFNLGVDENSTWYLSNSSDTKILNVTYTGKVGIGTSSPTADLSVGSITTATGDVTLRTTKTTFSITPSNTDAGGVELGLGWVAGGQGPMKFATGGSERMRIASSGNVGIGTSSPTAKVHLGTAGSEEIGIGLSNNQRYYGIQTTGGALTFKDVSAGGTERMRINSSGSVGINTSSPATQTGGIHVVHNAGEGTPTVIGSEVGIFQRNAVSAQSVSVSLISGTASTSSILFGDKDDIDAGELAWSNSSNSFSFNGGNVGVGTSSPSKPLEITDATNDGTGGVKITSYLPTLEMDDISGGGTSFILQHDGTSTLFKHDTAERMRIDSSGNVGIGDTSPNVKLDVYQSTTGIGVVDFRHVNGNRILINPSYNYHDAYNHIFRGLNGTSTHMTIDNSGNVGIGTSTPVYPLVVSNSGTQGLEFIVGTTNFIQSYNRSTSDYTPLRIDAETIAFATNNGSERMRIDSSGNVGIGTSAPAAKLEVAGGSTGLIISNLGDASAYDRVELQYSGYNSGTPVFKFRPTQTPGSGIVNSYFRFMNSNGTSTSANNYANVTIDGNVGIGTTAPVTSLSFGEASTGITFLSTATNFNSGKVAGIRGEVGGTGYGNLAFDTFQGGNGGGERMMIRYDGNVGIGTDAPSEKLHVSGNILATGNITAYSDKNLKENIEPILNAVEKVQQLNGVTYNRNDLEDTTKRYAGIIAQDLQAVLPEAVEGDSILRVDYNATIGLLIEAIKELKTEVDDLKAKLKEETK